jgi:hypothetical protein
MKTAALALVMGMTVQSTGSAFLISTELDNDPCMHVYADCLNTALITHEKPKPLQKAVDRCVKNSNACDERVRK